MSRLTGCAAAGFHRLSIGATLQGPRPRPLATPRPDGPVPSNPGMMFISSIGTPTDIYTYAPNCKKVALTAGRPHPLQGMGTSPPCPTVKARKLSDMISITFVDRDRTPRPVLHCSRDEVVTVTSRQKTASGTSARPFRTSSPAPQSACRPSIREPEPLHRRDGEADTRRRLATDV